MHTGIVFAIEADSAEEAVEQIYSLIEERTICDWSDWSETGGRWVTHLPDGPLRFQDDRKKFNELVDNFRQSTENTLIEIIKDYGHLTLDDLIGDPRYSFGFDRHEFTEETHGDRAEEGLADEKTEEDKQRDLKDSLATYNSIRALEIVQGRLTPDTHFFDLTGWTPSRKYLNERLKKSPSKQYLVMWDFHY